MSNPAIRTMSRGVPHGSIGAACSRNSRAMILPTGATNCSTTAMPWCERASPVHSSPPVWCRALGIGHQGASNPFNLADDVPEPFRPFVDLMAWKMGANEKDGNLSIEDRRAMAGALLVDARSGEDSVTLLVAAETAAQSLVRAFEERESRATPPAAACTPAPELEPVA